MINPFEEDDEPILEGFLCPICKEDLKTPLLLTSHVETLHSEEQDLLKSLKDIFSIAKKKIYKNIDDTVDLAKNFDSTLKPNFLQSNKLIPPLFAQEIGAYCDHMSYFKAIRTPRLERYATETNKLIIRLHKLLTDLPSDHNQRRIHEQSVVSWLDGKSVKLCPSCARSFYLARRQHHCRLCGSIMCHDCSCFLDINEAINLVNPAISTPSTEIELQDKEKNILRVCEHCIHLIETRKEMQDSRTYRPSVTKLYEQIQQMKKEISPDIPMYMKIISSLYEGDSIFTLADAGALRTKIGRAAEQIENTSKSLASLICPQGSREEALKNSIRNETIRYIKDDMLSIPPLPLEEQIQKIRDKRRQETEMRVERERRLAREAYEKYEMSGESPRAINTMHRAANGDSASGSAVNTLDNWSGHQTTAGSNIDPLIEQINIIKGYIKQARQATRFEEVAILEMNLRELQQEFYNRQQESIK